MGAIGCKGGHERIHYSDDSSCVSSVPGWLERKNVGVSVLASALPHSLKLRGERVRSSCKVMGALGRGGTLGKCGT